MATSATKEGKPAPVTWRPDAEQVVQYLQQMASVGETDRYKQLDRYEAFYRGLQYSHQRMDFWGKDPDLMETVSARTIIPAGFTNAGPGGLEGMTVRELRPTAPKGLAKTIVKRYTGLLLAEKRRPKVVMDDDPDTDAFLDAVREQAKFWQALRAARDLAGAMGAVCVTVHCREGEFSYDVHNAKNVTMLWKNRSKWQLSGILVTERREVQEDAKDNDGKPTGGTRSVQWLSRRIITEQEDIFFKDVSVEDAPTKGWERDEGRSTAHGLGFFPGIWIQNHSDTDEDGDPDCDQAWPTIDTIDRLLAQVNKGTLLNLDPTLMLKYDDKEITAQGGVRKGSDAALHVGAQGEARYLEMTGTGTDAGLKLLAELMKTVRDLTGYVPIDPDKISGAAQSAKAMEYLLEPMLERADDLRAQFGPAIAELHKITERIARGFVTQKLPLEGGKVGVFKFDLPARQVPIEGDETRSEYLPQRLGPGGHLSVSWPKYFQPTAVDDRLEIANATAANAAGFVTKETAARKVAEQFGVKDVPGEVAQAAAEFEEMASRGLGGEQPFGQQEDAPPLPSKDPTSAEGVS